MKTKASNVQRFTFFVLALTSDRLLFIVYRAIRKSRFIYLSTRSTKLVGGGN
jgi:hypothetical protein